jgi:hypothetical protein
MGPRLRGDDADFNCLGWLLRLEPKIVWNAYQVVA